MPSVDPITDLQTAVADALRSEGYFSNGAVKPIEVLTENLGDIENKISLAISKIGICAIVLTPIGKVENPDLPVANTRPRVVVAVVENVTLNRGATGTQQPCAKVMGAVVATLHQNTSLADILVFEGFALDAHLFKGKLAYLVSFTGPYVALTMPTR